MKTPIFGISGARSEKQDKRIWHQRVRALERTKQRTVANSELENYFPVSVLEASNVWSMGKDGRFYWVKSGHQSFSYKLAARKATNSVERNSLVKKNLHKIMSK